MEKNQKLSSQDFTRKLTELDYEFQGISQVSKTGQFSVRGSLIDLWLERYKIPVRFDLIGEKIEGIYLFNPITQEKVKSLNKVYIFPYSSLPVFAPKWAKKQIGNSEKLFLSEVEIGDLVVHIEHGIARFSGIEFRELQPKEGKTYLILEYAKGDKLFVPIEQIERVTKYLGVAGRKPALNYLGTGAWELTKQRVKEQVVSFAVDLLKVYAKREVSARKAYETDNPWLKELESSFEFEETPDQLQTIEAINKDLSSTKPMDRLLVGDVGFGKTEVALRTAFKAAVEARQVALLVPTTILAEQHFHFFRDRLASFPVKVALLSRFQEKEKQKEVLEGLKGGSVDIVIGTHRLLSKDVEFKNLGLAIIDEEHRFGVDAKEHFKKLRPEVDILSLSATPIPRTLQMAMAKIRKVSSLSTPPSGRQPIKTLVGSFDQDRVIQAVKAELDRKGQVYYVYNHIPLLGQKSAQLQRLFPEARIVYAHGQMGDRQLEEVMDQFYSREVDVLVCTTIIGSGLDMPNVNSIIIEDAQNFGLADLYQLRGRVGRAERQAFAFLFYPGKFTPKGSAFERLLAMAEATDLGAGFKIAKKDLEIRGAGNLLGKAQHGSIALVGFELYIQLLAQAVEQLI
ncbi:MAG: CarD family transcriptional regulator [bacterium]|nr:CarD family transcriptional regulator [bacterium]